MAEEKNIQSGTRAATQEGERILGDIKSKGRSLLTEEKQAVADQVGIFANALRKSEQYLRDRNQVVSARLVGKVSEQMAEIAGTMRDRDIDSLAQGVRRMAREKPETFFGIAVASGFVLSRFLKGSAQVVKEEGLQSPEQPQETVKTVPEMGEEMVEEEYPPMEMEPSEMAGDLGPEPQEIIAESGSEESREEKE